jgi:hypothetical protein
MDILMGCAIFDDPEDGWDIDPGDIADNDTGGGSGDGSFVDPEDGWDIDPGDIVGDEPCDPAVDDTCRPQ